MNRVSMGMLALLVGLSSAPALSDEVIAEAEDTTAGASLGATTGIMIGGAAGGPLGALIGAGAGLLLGKTAQQIGGLEERAYQVRTAQGDTRVVRSPNAEFSIGQQVELQGNRLYALER